MNLTIFFLLRTDFTEGQVSCIDTRVPECTSQTMSRGPIVSPSTFLSAGQTNRNKIRFQRFLKFIKNSPFMQIENFFRGSSSGDVYIEIRK